MITVFCRIVANAMAAAWFLVLAAPASAQIGGSGSIQGTVLDTSRRRCRERRSPRRMSATGVATTRQTTDAGVYAVSPLPPGEYRVDGPLDGFQTFVRDGVIVDALAVVGLNVTLQVGGVAQEVVGDRGAAAAGDRRRAPWPDHPQRGLHRAAAGDEHRRPARPDGLHVPDAGCAVDRPLGQRDGRAGLHQRHLRRGHADHQRRRAGRGTEPLVRHLGRSDRAVPGRNERHGRDVQRPGRLELRRQVRDEPRCAGARSSSSATRRSTRRAFFAATKPDDNQHEYGFTLGGPICGETACSSSWPTTATAIGGRPRRGSSRFRRAAQRNGDFSALPVTIYDPPTTRPNPNGTGFVRDPFPGNIIPAGPHLADLALLPVVSARPDQRRPAEQLSRRHRCRSASTTTTSPRRST